MKVLAKTKLTEHNDRKYLELRSYEIAGQHKVKAYHCLSLTPREHIHDGEEYMMLTRSQLKKGVIVNTQKSKFPPYENYQLVEFVWHPQKETSEVRVSPSEALVSLAERYPNRWSELGLKLHSK